jgi:hypothetical protein
VLDQELLEVFDRIAGSTAPQESVARHHFIPLGAGGRCRRLSEARELVVGSARDLLTLHLASQRLVSNTPSDTGGHLLRAAGEKALLLGTHLGAKGGLHEGSDDPAG